MSEKNRPPSSVDVAKLAGVSRTAVSRTFSNKGYVSKATKDKVIKAANELGYRVNYLAKGLTNLRSNLVGLVMSDIDTPFRAKQVSALSDALLENDYHPLLVPTSDRRDCSSVIELLLRYNVGGVVITSDTPPDDIYFQCVKHEIPVIFINKAEQNYTTDRIECDNQQGVELAANAFLQYGTEVVNIIDISSNSYSIRERTWRFKEYAEQIGLLTQVITVSHHTYEKGFEAGGLFIETMNDDLNRSSEKALNIGVFCCNDLLALGFSDYLKQAGNINNNVNSYNIPIIGFDGISQMNWAGHQITTIEQSVNEMSSCVVDTLIERQANPESPPMLKIYGVELKRHGILNCSSKKNG